MTMAYISIHFERIQITLATIFGMLLLCDRVDCMTQHNTLDHPAKQNTKCVAGLMLSRIKITNIVKCNLYIHTHVCTYV